MLRVLGDAAPLGSIVQETVDPNSSPVVLAREKGIGKDMVGSGDVSAKPSSQILTYEIPYAKQT